jgi:hypothetical protein
MTEPRITRWIIFSNKGDPCFQATRYTADQQYINEQLENHQGLYDEAYLVAEMSDIKFALKKLKSAYDDLQDRVTVTPESFPHYLKALELIEGILKT